MFSDVKGRSYTPLSTGRRWGCVQVTLAHERNEASWSLTVYGCDVVRQVGPRGGPGPLHEQVTIRAPVAGHQVVKLSRAGPWRGRRESEQASFFQVFVGHCRGEEEGEGWIIFPTFGVPACILSGHFPRVLKTRHMLQYDSSLPVTSIKTITTS